MVYDANRYDENDPELFMAHGTDDRNPTTAFSEATELQDIYDSLDVYSKLCTPRGSRSRGLECESGRKSLSELTFDFIVWRQDLMAE